MLLGNDPRDVLVVLVRIRVTVGSLQSTGGEQPGSHQEGADEKGGATTELVEIKNGWESHSHINDVLN